MNLPGSLEAAVQVDAFQGAFHRHAPLLRAAAKCAAVGVVCLVAKGLPDEMIKDATAKTQQIKAAYEQIREARGS